MLNLREPSLEALACSIFAMLCDDCVTHAMVHSEQVLGKRLIVRLIEECSLDMLTSFTDVRNGFWMNFFQVTVIYSSSKSSPFVPSCIDYLFMSESVGSYLPCIQVLVAFQIPQGLTEWFLSFLTHVFQLLLYKSRNNMS